MNSSDPRPVAPGLGAILVVIAVVISVTIAGKKIGVFGVFLGTIAGTTHLFYFPSKNFNFDPNCSNFPIKIALFASITLAAALLSYYVAEETAKNKKKFSLVLTLSIDFAAVGGTSFYKANLDQADFTNAILKSTNFCKASLIQTCWHQAKMLDRTRPGTTYLQNANLREWLVVGRGQHKNFDRQDLRGVYLKGADLEEASFIGADLSEANLQDANLSGAKLVQTQLDGTDFTGAILTRATIEDWNITSYTKLNGVKCEYIFMRLPTPNDPNPRRKPDNWNETFKDGDFADFIKPIVDTLDLYHNRDVDPRAIAISFKQLAENHPDAELEIVALEKRGQDKFLLRARTTDSADKSELSKEYFEIYNELKALAQQEVKALMAEKDSRIASLENMVVTALQSPSFYAQTY